MRKIVASIASLVVLGACDPGAAPPSANKPVAVTREALATLFKQECVTQRSADWVRAKSAYMTIGCRWPFYDDNCVINLDGAVGWTVATTSGVTTEIEMGWPAEDLGFTGPPDGRLGCELSVESEDGQALRPVADRLASDMLGVVAPTGHDRVEFEGGTSEAWRWEGNRPTPALGLARHTWPDGRVRWELCLIAFRSPDCAWSAKSQNRAAHAR